MRTSEIQVAPNLQIRNLKKILEEGEFLSEEH